MRNALVSIFIVTVLALASLVFATPAQNPCRSALGGHCLNISAAAVIPGAKFLGDTGNTGGLIANLYTFGMGLVGVSALIMLVLGGVIYTTAGDSQSRVNQARSMIGNAVFGLILALVSYLILYTINPDIVTRGFPEPKEISPYSKLQAPRRIYATSDQTDYWVCSATVATPYANQEECAQRCPTKDCQLRTRPQPKTTRPSTSTAPPAEGVGSGQR